MRIGIFIVTAGRQGGGPETYEIQLVRALAQLDTTNEYFIYCTSRQGPPAVGVSQPNFHFRVLWPASRWISVPISLPIQMILDRLDFYHATMVPPPWSPKPFLLTILCSSNWIHPEFYQKRVVWRLNKLLERSLYHARFLLCISRDLLGDVKKIWGIPEARMQVTYMGVGEEFYPREIPRSRQLLEERYGIAGRFLLFIGQQQERKNVFRVVEAYAQFCKRAKSGGTTDLPKLLLVGRADNPTDAIAEKIREHFIEADVKRVRYVSHADLPDLYSVADALLFPSLWEGFGLPVIEAMACGIPVVTSTATCLPEVAGDAAIIVDPESVSAIADAITALHEQPQLRQELIGKGFERAKQFTWADCAAVTLQAYQAMRQATSVSTPTESVVRPH